MTTATLAESEAFVAYMAHRFNARIVRKSAAIEMRLLGALLETFTRGAVKLDDFLGQFATTVGFVVYLPDGLTPDDTMQVVVHECEHVQQFWVGKLQFAWWYLVYGEKRAEYEAQAYASGAEFEHARTGVLPTLASLAEPFHSPAYMAGVHDVELATKILESRGTSMSHKVYVGMAARAAVEYLQTHAPHLLAT